MGDDEMSTKTKTIKFDEVMKNFKKFVSSSVTRPVLQYVRYDGTNLTATNSHILLQVNAEYVEDMPSEQPFLYNPETNEFDDSGMNFPQVDRLFPNMFKAEGTFGNLKNLKDANHEAKKMHKSARHKVVKLKCENDKLVIGSRDNTVKSEVDIESSDNWEMALNGMYFQHTIEVAKKLKKLSKGKTKFGFTSHMRPFTVEQDDVFKALILPIRL